MSKIDKVPVSITDVIKPQEQLPTSGLMAMLAKRKGMVFAVLLAAASAVNCKGSCNCAGCNIVSCDVDSDNFKLDSCGKKHEEE